MSSNLLEIFITCWYDINDKAVSCTDSSIYQSRGFRLSIPKFVVAGILAVPYYDKNQVHCIKPTIVMKNSDKFVELTADEIARYLSLVDASGTEDIDDLWIKHPKSGKQQRFRVLDNEHFDHHHEFMCGLAWYHFNVENIKVDRVDSFGNYDEIVLERELADLNKYKEKVERQKDFCDKLKTFALTNELINENHNVESLIVKTLDWLNAPLNISFISRTISQLWFPALFSVSYGRNNSELIAKVHQLIVSSKVLRVL